MTGAHNQDHDDDDDNDDDSGADARDARDTAALARLTAILAHANEAAHSDLRARLQWLEDAALAADACDLDERGKSGAVDLKAALGAVAKYAQAVARARELGAGTPSVDQLEAVVRVLILRGTSSLYAALADAWEELVDEGPMRAQGKLLADALHALATSTARGQSPSPSALAKIVEAASSLPDDVKKK